jgi:pimeloyl-ACP methyl ester carboxylesterase
MRESTAGRRWLVVLLVLALVLTPLTVNAFLVDSATRAAAPRDGGSIVETGIVPANVKVEGGGSGTPIVLIHGFGAALDWWDEIAPTLAADRKVIRLDLIGHGGTEAPVSGYSIERQAAMVKGVLDKLGVVRVIAIGHSMGGEVVTELAETHPQLIEKMVLIDTPPKTEIAPKKPGNIPIPLWDEFMWRFVGKEEFRKALAQRFAPGFQVPDRFIADLEQLTYRAFTSGHAGGVDFEDSKPVFERLAAIGNTTPLLVITGAEDPLVTPEKAKLYEQVPGAKVATIEGAGHSPMVEKPEQTLSLIKDFLAQP